MIKKMKKDNIEKQDSEVFAILKKEEERKSSTLEMIPSENHTSPAVLEALSSIFNDKYAEGYPGKRYYGGNQFVDEMEVLCQQRAQQLFNVPFANVQPYSGSPANMAVYFATLNPGDKVLGMHLSAGGHLTHGWKVNFSGQYYQSFFYGVEEKTHLIDYQEVEELAHKEKPRLIIMGATAYPREIDFAKFREIADSVGAYLCADISHTAGLVASGCYQNPAQTAHIITTTTHKTLRGPRGALIMVTESGLGKDPQLIEKINKAVFPGLQGGPHVHQIAGIAVCLKEAMTEEFQLYGPQVIRNAQVLGDELKRRGFELITGGTENHLLLVDLRKKDVTGKKAQELLEQAGIIINKNAVPFDPNPPADPSGIRLGTPALTTRGMQEKEMRKIAGLIDNVITEPKEEVVEEVRKQVREVGKDFPL